MKKIYLILFFIVLLISVLFRFFDINKADVITDEAVLGIRSVGYIDFFMSEYQTTPFDWYGEGEIPFWARLSFHDHPPLVFMIQHLSFSLFGQTVFALRFPSALFGVLTVVLVWFFTSKLLDVFSKNISEFLKTNISLLAMFFISVSTYHIWVSRIGLQESVVVFLNLLSVYVFLKFLQNEKYFVLWGAVSGLAILAKYTNIVVVFFGIFYILLFKREFFKSMRFWKGCAMLLLFFSPVIVYNMYMFAERGHFDFQFSYFFGQTVPEWMNRVGREQVGGFFDRVYGLLPGMAQGASFGIGVLWAVSFVFSVWKTARSRKMSGSTVDVFLFFVIILHLLLFLVIGPQERFLVMVVPYLVVLSSYYLFSFLSWAYQKKKIIGYFSVIVLMLVFGYEAYFSFQTNIDVEKLSGRARVDYSDLKLNSLSWGFNQADAYMKKNLYDRYYPAFTFPTRYVFLEKIKSKSIENAKKQGKESMPALLIYDQNINSESIVWYFYRPFIYQGWPYISAKTYMDIMENQGNDFFYKQGIRSFYFIKAKNTLMRKERDFVSDVSTELTNQLDMRGTVFYPVYAQGREALRIYSWSE